MSYMRPIYTRTARFDEAARALTEDELRKLAPSIFAVAAHESRSERFQPIPTFDILQSLAREGFSVVGATQSTTRDPGKKDFTKHLIRLRRLDDTEHKVGDVLPEVILRNANDGTAAYELMAGLFRIRCLNSLVAQVSTLESTKVRHSGRAEAVRDNVIEGTYRVIDAAQKALAAPEAWSGINLSVEDRLMLADAAHEVRWPTTPEAQDNEHAAGEVRRIPSTELLRARRPGDANHDLWTTMNVLQENVIRGGQHFTRRTLNDEGRMQATRARTREVKGVDQLVGLNKALWMITNHFAEQRGVKIAA